MAPAELVCKFYQFGHCKYDEVCHHQHVNILCEVEQCDQRAVHEDIQEGVYIFSD